MAVLNAVEKAYVRHAVCQELEKRDRGSSAVITDKDFADAMGVHPNTVMNMKKRPAVSEAVAKGVAEIDQNHDYYMLALKRRAIEELWSNYKASTGAERRHYLTKIMDITAGVEEHDDSPEYQDMTDDDLIALCLKREVSPLGMSRSELAALVSREKKGAK